MTKRDLSRVDVRLDKMKATDPEIHRRIREAVAKPRTKEERFEQKVSWVYGNQPREMNLTRERIREIILDMD